MPSLDIELVIIINFRCPVHNMRIAKVKFDILHLGCASGKCKGISIKPYLL